MNLMPQITRFACLAVFASLVIGCSTTAVPTYTSSGVAGYRINCGGFLGDGDLGSCYQKAGDVCMAQGYRVLQTSLGSLIVECKPNDTDLPARQ
jgi:hypothetical protein